MLLLFHKVSNNALRLSQVLHGEASDLVHSHNLGHGGENKNGIEFTSAGFDDCDNLLGKLLNKDKRSNKDVGIVDILFELSVGIVVTEFLQKVSDTFYVHVFVGGIDALHGGSHGRLVLRFQDNIDNFHSWAVTWVFGNDTTVFRIGSSEHTASSHRHGILGWVRDDAQGSGRLKTVGNFGNSSLIGHERSVGRPSVIRERKKELIH